MIPVINARLVECSSCLRYQPSSTKPGRGRCTLHQKKVTLDDICQDYVDHQPVCGECVHLHQPLRGKTCFNDYGRTEDSPICDGLTKTRRFLKKPSARLIDNPSPHLRDAASDVLLDVLDLPEKAGVVIRSADAKFGLMVIVLDDRSMRVHPVEFDRGELVKHEREDEPTNTAFSGEVYSVDANGEMSLCSGEFRTMVVSLTDHQRAWRLVESSAEEQASSLPASIQPNRMSGDLGSAMQVVRTLMAKGMNRTSAITRCIQRFSKARGWSAEEADAFREKLSDEIQEAD